MQNKNSVYSELKFINEDQDPCLKILKKKIRNSIKKLQDIKELETKEFLQPQQIQKVNRKQKYTNERDRYVDFVVVYRQILIQNQQHYLKQQYQQIDRLANAFTLLAYQGNTQQKDILDLKKLVIQQNLNQSWKLKKTKNMQILKKFLLNQSSNSKITQTLSQNQKKIKLIQNQQKVQVNKSKQMNQKIEDNKNEISRLGRHSIVNTQSKQSISSKQIIQRQQVKKQQKTQQQISQSVRSQLKRKQRQKIKIQEKDKVIKEKKDKKPRKSKNKEKNNQQEISKGQVQGQLRFFKKQEIKDLQDEGFIVVGKPKAKTRDQKKWYDHQHGRKSYPNKRQLR